MKFKNKKTQIKVFFISSVFILGTIFIIAKCGFSSDKKTDKTAPASKTVVKKENLNSVEKDSSSKKENISDNSKEKVVIEEEIPEILKEDYIVYSQSQSDKFRNILNKYNIDTISIEPKEGFEYLNETSIYQNDLGIPNGYKTILIDNDINKKVQLYMSLTNSINEDNSWGEIINITAIYEEVQEVGDIFTDNKEIEEVIKAFCNENFNYDELKDDISLLLSTSELHLTKENYSLSRENVDNNISLSVHINSNNGLIKKQ